MILPSQQPITLSIFYCNFLGNAFLYSITSFSHSFFKFFFKFGTRKAEVLNSLIINTTAKAVVSFACCIVCFGRSIYYKVFFKCSTDFQHFSWGTYRQTKMWAL